jgi:hypothetical protein
VHMRAEEVSSLLLLFVVFIAVENMLNWDEHFVLRRSECIHGSLFDTVVKWAVFRGTKLSGSCPGNHSGCPSQGSVFVAT